MNKSEIRAAARTVTELDVSDVADATIDLYIKDGYDRIIALERRWPFFETNASLTCVAGQRDYPLSAIGPGSWSEIVSLVGSTPGVRLQLISYDQGEDSFIARNPDYLGQPRYYSVWGGGVQLWPKPDSGYTLQVRGYRKPNSWHLQDAVEVDCDERFHRSLIYFTVAQLYQLQEDVEMAASYRASFEEAVRLVQADIVKAPSHVPLVLSGGDPIWDKRWWI